MDASKHDSETNIQLYLKYQEPLAGLKCDMICNDVNTFYSMKWDIRDMCFSTYLAPSTSMLI